MENKDLDSLAKETGLDLPESYREFMLAFPAELYDLENEAGEPFSDYEFIDDVDRVIELNVEAREDPYFSAEIDGEKEWPPTFLVIGENGNGGYYCVDIENDPLTVYLFDNKDGEFTEIADDLKAFVETLKNRLEEIEVEPLDIGSPGDDDDINDAEVGSDDDDDDDDDDAGFGDLDEIGSDEEE